jgi:hypothetical protein
MKISNLMAELAQFQKHFGDVEMEFALAKPYGDEDSIDCEFYKIHDSNLDGQTTCCLYMVEEA